MVIHTNTRTPIRKRGQLWWFHKFECRLVGDSESKYVLAILKGTEKAVDTAKDKFKNGSVWILSQIKFEENTSSPYISSPLKISVDLVKSNLQCSQDPELESCWLRYRFHFAQ